MGPTAFVVLVTFKDGKRSFNDYVYSTQFEIDKLFRSLILDSDVESFVVDRTDVLVEELAQEGE